MAALTPADLEVALGVTFTGTANFPLFEIGSKVWSLLDLPVPVLAANTNTVNRRYTVLDSELGNALISASTEVNDQSGVRCDATTPASVATVDARYTGTHAFQHTATASATTGATQLSRGWFYEIQDDITSAVYKNVPQTLLNSQTNWDTYLAAQAANMTA